MSLQMQYAVLRYHAHLYSRSSSLFQYSRYTSLPGRHIQCFMSTYVEVVSSVHIREVLHIYSRSSSLCQYEQTYFSIRQTCIVLSVNIRKSSSLCQYSISVYISRTYFCRSKISRSSSLYRHTYHSLLSIHTSVHAFTYKTCRRTSLPLNNSVYFSRTSSVCQK